MKILEQLTSLSMPKFSLLFGLFQNPLIGLNILLPTLVVVPVVDFWGAVWLLMTLFCVDLITGILASYFEWKKLPDKNEKYFFGKGEGFSSDKFKKMFIKLLIYLGTPILVEHFEKIFMIKHFSYKTFSDAEISIATFLILVFCLNEGFSIFHENLPKCGFNFWEQIRKMIGFYKEAKKEIQQ